MNKYLAFFLFALTIPLANWFISNIGTTCIPDGPCLIPVGFGLMAPSGVLFIGLALVLRDWLQELTDWKWSLVAVLLGGLLSLMTSSPYIAVASAVAFVVAELFDLGVYTPLRKKGKHLAVLASGVVGSFVDSVLFVLIAFGSVELAFGTVIAKMYASVVVAAYLFWKGRSKV
jgi:queuosine precursor transporter